MPISDRKVKILVVDDEAINLHLITDILRDRYDVSVVKSGEKALKVFPEISPDILILDIHMSGINGFEVAQHILQEYPNKDIPILFLSADSNIDYILKGFELGAVDYMIKPLEKYSFLLKIGFLEKLVRKTYESKRREQLLAEYKNTVDRSFIVSKTDKKGRITYVNDRFCEISGYSREELLGKSHSIVRHEDMSSKVFQQLWETIQARDPWFGVVKNKTKEGKAYYVDTVINPIVNENGEIIEYIGVRNDITELEEYKEILKDELMNTSQSYQENINYMMQYEAAINSVNGVIKTDTDNKITHANSKFCQMSGYTYQELLGMDCTKLRDVEHQEKKDCENVKEKLSKQKRVTKLLKNRTKEGKVFHMSTLFYPIVDVEGKTIEHLQVMHDVTEIIELNQEIVDTQKEIVLTMGAIGETRSKETGLHVKRVAEYSYLLATLYGLEEEHAQRIKQASPMHDIGKVGIADSILNKPGKLTEDEFEIMKTHAELGYEMLKHSQRPILKTAAIVAYTHHERYAGDGYPNGMRGEDIPIEGRITAVADVFDALGHDRCYKKAWELERILDLFKKERGKHFDPKLIDLFMQNLDKFLEIRDILEDKVDR
ncbi:MAG: PAS domain S-box protein [Sulfurimonas sp.]|jgi:PAS domain S-box-containing protein|nr:PAS domain S-box protein [Sulfurimonas sp.]